MLIGVLLLFLVAVFAFWRIDSPRAERFRAQIVDAVVPSFEWALVPVTRFVEMAENFQSYANIYEQNQELRRELQEMKIWKEAATQLELENAELRALTNLRVDARLSYVSGVVMADSGTPFRQTVLLNIGARDGLVDGWAAMTGSGLAGRVSGVGERTARVILLTDASSRLPVLIQPSGQTAILMGDNSAAPPLQFIEKPDQVRPGDRVVSSGDGGVLPAGLLVGEVFQGADRRLRVRLAADYEYLSFLRVLRSHPGEVVDDTGALVALHPAPVAPLEESEDGDAAENAAEETP